MYNNYQFSDIYIKGDINNNILNLSNASIIFNEQTINLNLSLNLNSYYWEITTLLHNLVFSNVEYSGLINIKGSTNNDNIIIVAYTKPPTVISKHRSN